MGNAPGFCFPRCSTYGYPVELGDVSAEKVRKAAQALRSSKAAGPKGIPTEYWKTILQPGTDAFLLLALFKKGDTSSCENYRPIFLLDISHKLFAVILLSRVRVADYQ